MSLAQPLQREGLGFLLFKDQIPMSRFTYSPPSGGWPPDRSARAEFQNSASGQSKTKFCEPKGRETGDHAPGAQPVMRPSGMGEQSVDRTAHYSKKEKLAAREGRFQKNANDRNALLKERAEKARVKIDSKNDRIEREKPRDR